MDLMIQLKMLTTMACLILQTVLVLKDLPVQWDQLELKVHKVHKVHKEMMVHKVHKVHKGTKVHKVHKVLKVQQVL